MKPQNNEKKEREIPEAEDAAEETKPLEIKAETVETVIKEVRHTISAEETFTLAKDVFDLRCLIKSVYANRAQILRRLSIVNTILSSVFTLLYVGFMVFLGVNKIVAYTSWIAVFSIIGVHVLFTAVLVAFSLVWGINSNTKSVKKKKRVLTWLRLTVRISSLLMGITAVIMSLISGTSDVVAVALDTIALIISIVFVILSLFPLIFGGLGGLARWLISPTKVKLKFSFVVLEWFQLLSSENAASKTIRRVSKNYLNDIGRCVDNVLLPALGKKKVANVNSGHLITLVERVPEGDRHITEGVIKNVFEYAMECGYIVSDPCKEIELQGSIEVEEKKKKAKAAQKTQKPKKPTLKERIGKKIGKKLVSTLLGDTSGEED